MHSNLCSGTRITHRTTLETSQRKHDRKPGMQEAEGTREGNYNLALAHRAGLSQQCYPAAYKNVTIQLCPHHQVTIKAGVSPQRISHSPDS